MRWLLKVELELEENRHRRQHTPPPSTSSTDHNPLQPFLITPCSIIPLVHDRLDDPSTCIIHKQRQGISTHAPYHHGPADWRTSASKTAGRNGRTRGGLPPMGHLHSRRGGGGHGRPPFLDRNVLHRVNYPNRTIIRSKKNAMVVGELLERDERSLWTLEGGLLPVAISSNIPGIVYLAQFGHRMRNCSSCIRMDGDGKSMDWDPSDKSVVDRMRVMELGGRPGGREWERRC
jgi:hypothetical protein